MIRSILSAASASLLAVSIAALSPAMAQSVAITGGTLVIGDESEPIENGTLIIRNGKVVAAGTNVAVPADIEVINANGKWVTPGIIAGFSRLGIVEVGAVSSTNDISASKSPFSAAIDIAPAFNPNGVPVAVNRSAGVTRAVVAPGSGHSLFAGYGAIVDLGADYDAITAARAFQFIELGEAGAADAGGSRAAAHAMVRALFAEAQSYARAPSAFESDLLTRADAAALNEIITGRTRLFIHVERASDILQALQLKREYPALKPILVGAAEGWMVAREIAAANVPVIASALNNLPEYFEKLAATQSNIGRMRAAGVTVGIGMINDRDGHQLRYAPQYAGNLVAISKLPGHQGLSWSQAFAAISSKLAEAIGMEDRLGSLKPGRVGDVVIWDKDPLELGSAAEAVFIDGVAQPLDNRQRKLRDRYRSIDETALPQAYEH